MAHSQSAAQPSLLDRNVARCGSRTIVPPSKTTSGLVPGGCHASNRQDVRDKSFSIRIAALPPDEKRRSMRLRGVPKYDARESTMKRCALFSITILVLAGGGLTRTTRAGPPFPTDAAIPAITERLRDEDDSVRQAAIYALRAMGPEAKSAIPALAQLLRDRDGYVAIDACQALGEMGAAAVPSLAELLRDELPRVRVLAARTLQQIGPDAKGAVPALTERLGDWDGSVRQAAISARARWGRRQSRRYQPWPNSSATEMDTSRLMPPTRWKSWGQRPCPASCICLETGSHVSANWPRGRCVRSRQKQYPSLRKTAAEAIEQAPMRRLPRQPSYVVGFSKTPHAVERRLRYSSIVVRPVATSNSQIAGTSMAAVVKP